MKLCKTSWRLIKLYEAPQGFVRPGNATATVCRLSVRVATNTGNDTGNWFQDLNWYWYWYWNLSPQVIRSGCGTGTSTGSCTIAGMGTTGTSPGSEILILFTPVLALALVLVLALGKAVEFGVRGVWLWVFSITTLLQMIPKPLLNYETDVLMPVLASRLWS